MTNVERERHNNPKQSDPLRVIRDETEEEIAYWKLHPSVRKMLQDCPYEFSAIDAQTIWEMCVGRLDSIGTFRKVLDKNVEFLRNAEAALGIGPDPSVLPKYSMLVIEKFEKADEVIQGVPDAFDMYSVAPSSSTTRFKLFQEPT